MCKYFKFGWLTLPVPIYYTLDLFRQMKMLRTESQIEFYHTDLLIQAHGIDTGSNSMFCRVLSESMSSAKSQSMTYLFLLLIMLFFIAGDINQNLHIYMDRKSVQRLPVSTGNMIVQLVTS